MMKHFRRNMHMWKIFMRMMSAGRRFAFGKGWRGSPLRRGLPAESLARRWARGQGMIRAATGA